MIPPSADGKALVVLQDLKINGPVITGERAMPGATQEDDDYMCLEVMIVEGLLRLRLYPNKPVPLEDRVGTTRSRDHEMSTQALSMSKGAIYLDYMSKSLFFSRLKTEARTCSRHATSFNPWSLGWSRLSISALFLSRSKDPGPSAFSHTRS